MKARPLLAVTVLACIAGCTSSKQYAMLLEQVDGYTIARPIKEAWPDAIRFVNQRGFTPVGGDRKLADLPETSPWGTIFSKGHETYVSGKTWKSETAMNQRYQRYRILGKETGAATCRIEFYSIFSDDPTRPGGLDENDAVSRDAELELAFIATFDPDGAARISRAAGGQ